MQIFPKWQESEMNILRKYAATLTAEDIGLIIGRSKHAVKSKARDLHISLQKRGDCHHSAKYSQADTELARQLYAEGVRPRHIAEKLGIKSISIGNYLY
ncbi:DNA-binding protein [Serratia liquefaciens]|uniref:DNA-binding protein n=1 Tax=Serratia liquefaciens TaxID=614 RepID=UPI00159FFFEA|nr:DNA-binding protein [Serratia liquefaciens]NWA20299.1 DNA-binding protein [Serratia liquefaciens]